MKKDISIKLVVAVVVFVSISAASAEPIRVLLARTSTSVSEAVVRSTLLQMNSTMGNSSLGSLDFVAADTLLGVPVVDFISCGSSDPVSLLTCLQSGLTSRRNAVNADIVVVVAPLVGVLCGAVPPSMINAPLVAVWNQYLAYAVLKQDCITAPSNNMKVASHEVGHLLSLEHHDSDPLTDLPLGFSDNHAEEDFDDHTVMGSPVDDCISPFVSCNGHDFFSQDGRQFPDGGSAGNSSESNAVSVISSSTWNVVSQYRPLIPPTLASGHVELLFCIGWNATHSVAWGGPLNYPGDYFVVERKNQLWPWLNIWYPFYEGGAGATEYTTKDDRTDFRVKVVSIGGTSIWVNFWTNENCMGGAF